MAGRREGGELLAELALFVEQFVRPVALHPLFELLQMLGVLEVGDRDLMGAPGAFDRLAVDEFRPGPALGRAKHDHRPARTLRTLRLAARSCGGLDPANLGQDHVERAGERLMHERRIVAFDEMRIVAVAAQQLRQLLAADAGEHRRIGDLETVEMKDRQNRAIARRIEELVGVPAGGQRAGFRLAVADDAGDDQVGIVEGGAVGMDQRIAQLSAFMDGPGRFRRHMTGNSIGPGKLTKEAMQSDPAAFDRRIALRVGPFQIGLRHQARAAMAGTDDVDHVQIVFLDQPIEVDVEKIQSGRRAPVPEQARLDVLERERGFEQGIALQVNLADREVIRCAPIGVHPVEEIGRQGAGRLGFHDRFPLVSRGEAANR